MLTIGLVNVTPGLPQWDDGSDASTTKSAIVEGTVIITDTAGQMKKTGQMPEEAVAGLNRNTEEAHRALADNPNIEALLKKQETFADLAGKLNGAMKTTIGEISAGMMKATIKDPKNPKDRGDERWAPGGLYHAALSAAAAGVYGELNSGVGAETALARFAGLLAKNDIDKFSEEVGKEWGKGQSEGIQKMIGNSFGALLQQYMGATMGGISGAAVNSPPPPNPNKK